MRSGEGMGKEGGGSVKTSAPALRASRTIQLGRRGHLHHGARAVVGVDEGELETRHHMRFVHLEGHHALLVYAHEFHDQACGALRGVDSSRREGLIQPCCVV